MAGYSTSVDGDFDRVYMSNSTLFDQFVGTQLWVCGQNTYGMLGDGTTVNKSSLVTVAGGGTIWSQVSCSYAIAAVKTDGTLWTWGRDNYGTLGNGTTIDRSSPVTTAGGGTTWSPIIDLGSYHSSAIKTDGTLWTWGQNTSGKLGDGTTIDRSSPVTTAGGGTNWRQVASAGVHHGAAIKTDGTLWTWGQNLNGQLGDGTTVSKTSPITTAGGGTNWRQVACGYYAAAAIKTDGTLWTWGNNTTYGMLGDGTTLNRSSPITTVAGGTTWKQVSAAYYSFAAIKTDGTLWTCGYNSNGNLGDGTILYRSSPVTTAGGGTNWKQISIGRGGAAGIKTDGTLWIWGNNSYGNLGDGTTLSRSSPATVVSNITTWKSVSYPRYTLAALAQN